MLGWKGHGTNGMTNSTVSEPTGWEDIMQCGVLVNAVDKLQEWLNISGLFRQRHRGLKTFPNIVCEQSM